MGAERFDLPVHSPLAGGVGLDSDFVRQVLGKREARRLSALFEEAETRARRRMEIAREEAEEIFDEARAEAQALLAMLPDFAALEARKAASGATALKIIRRAADRHGLPIAVVTGTKVPARTRSMADRARREAIRDLRAAFPGISDDELGRLFGGRSGATIAKFMRGWA